MRLSISLCLIFILGFVVTNCQRNSSNSIKSSFNTIDAEVRVRIIQAVDSVQITTQSITWEVIDSTNNKNLITLEAKQSYTICSIMDKKSTPTRWQIKSKGVLIWEGSSNLFLKPSASIQTDSLLNQSLIISNVAYGVGWWWEGKEDRFYNGKLHFFGEQPSKVSVAIHLPMEEYLKGVVPYEIGPEAPIEALKAQAIAARSEAVVALKSGLYAGADFDLTSDVECQVYAGNKRRTVNTDLAISATQGQYLVENGSAINAYYASNCGGASEVIEKVWPERPRPESYAVSLVDYENREPAKNLNLVTDDVAFLDWLKGSPDVWCNPNRGIELPAFSQANFRWERSFSHAEMDANLVSNLQTSTALAIDEEFVFKQFEVLERGDSGRIIKARIHFTNERKIEVKGELAIRQLWSPALRSSAFIIEKDAATSSSKEPMWKIRGAGWGHGVGMCQSGAIAMAKSGYSAEAIVSHYYPKAVVSGN